MAARRRGRARPSPDQLNARGIRPDLRLFPALADVPPFHPEDYGRDPDDRAEAHAAAVAYAQDVDPGEWPGTLAWNVYRPHARARGWLRKRRDM